jgi:hypothetical protein
MGENAQSWKNVNLYAFHYETRSIKVRFSINTDDIDPLDTFSWCKKQKFKINQQ